MTARRLAALRNLAERPGTDAEGRVAWAKLARAEAQRETAPDESGRKICECGYRVRWGDNCRNTDQHDRIRAEIRRRFPRGARVFYSCWAYPPNCPGTVVGYSDLWNWVRVKFDHLKSARRVPAYRACGWHLSTVPLTPEEMRPARGAMRQSPPPYQVGRTEGRTEAGPYRLPMRSAVRQRTAGAGPLP